MLKPLTRAAIELHEKYGWNVIPAKGKVAVGEWKRLQEELTTLAIIEKTFARYGVDAIAVINGPISNDLSILDFDDLKYHDTWKSGNYLKLPDTCPIATTGKGLHIYFRGPSYFKKYEYGEYRGDSRHYSIVPPSMHPSGRLYEWLVFPSDEIPYLSKPVDYGLGISDLLGRVPTNREVNTTKNSKTTGKVNTSSSLQCHSAFRDDDFDTRFSLGVARNRGWLETEEVRRLALLHQPTRIGHRNHKIFGYVRALQSTAVSWTFDKAKVALKIWWVLAKEVVGTKDWETSWIDFLRAWSACRKPVEGLDVVRLLESSQPLRLHPRLDGYPEDLKKLVRACYFLQTLGSGSFYLSNDDAGKIVGKGRYVGYKMMKRLVGEGMVVKQSVGNNISQKASCYYCRSVIC